MNRYDTIKLALQRGYPTAAERRQWTPNDWSAFHDEKARRDQQAYDELPDTDPRKLLDRIAALEDRVNELELKR